MRGSEKDAVELKSCRKDLDATIAELSNKYEELVLLYDVSESLGSLKNIYQLTDLILEKAVQHSQADNGLLLITDREKGVLTVRSMYGIHWVDPAKYVIRVGRGIVGRVAETGQAVIQNELKVGGMKAGKPVTAILCVPLKVKETIIGVISVAHSKPGKMFTSVEQKLLAALAGQAAIALENARLYQETKKMFLNIISSLAATIDAKDPYTHGHSQRVTLFAGMIGEAIGAPPEFLEELRLAGLLHDVGKIGISESILRKVETLTAEEYKIMMDHPVIGVRILGHIDALRSVVPAIKHHHERYGGGGYPDGLKGEDIPLAARIISIADCFDALTIDRPYRKALSGEEAFSEMENVMSGQFDPALLRVFAETWGRKKRESAEE